MQVMEVPAPVKCSKADSHNDSWRCLQQSSAARLNLPLAAMQVMGVITRKDIAEANAKLALGRKANLGLTTPSDRLVRHGSLPFIPYGAYDPTVGYSSSRCGLAYACIDTYMVGLEATNTCMG